ncbi:outer membrane beta-barrel protein [Caulobacter sp. 17J80-11]|uniref:porin n=1 Tax=Caulobacter sp. 17J80-11 TaxID=2763502 RepID=UPI0016537D0A|nr:outer membrane beta-barrel protein [Caulobacter sp. 17J80-11]MBC6980617.1 porin [Caulobacter sp. 17J80-11]
MKNVLFASAALAAVAFAAPAFAQDTSGYFGAGYTRTGSDVETYDLNASVAFKPTDQIGVQLDAGYTSLQIDDEFSSENAFGAGAHVFTRNDQWAVGGFAAVSNSDSVSTYNLGVEGAKYFDNLTVAGTIAYGSSDDLDADAWGVGGEVRYFLTDNFRLNAGLGYADADYDKVWSAGLGGEYQLSSKPFSVYAGYTHYQFDDADIDEDKLSIGMRVSFGGQTLKGRDRSGASFTGAAGVFGGAF